jgi:hypothetical protein
MKAFHGDPANGLAIDYADKLIELMETCDD